MEKRTVLENIKVFYPEMFTAERRVAKFILKNPEKAVMTNVSELAQLSGVSDATVIRMCKRVGYQGYYQMKIILSNDLGRNQLENLRSGEKKPNNVTELFQVFTSNIIDLGNNLNPETLSICVKLIKGSEIVHIAAAGNTAPLANDLGFRLQRFGVRTSFSMVSDYLLSHISLATPKDLLIALSHSGTSKQVVQAMTLAKERGLKSMTITGSAQSPVASLADYTLLSGLKHPFFLEYDPDSHLGIVVVIDALLYFVSNEVTLKPTDEVELLLAEYKL